MGLTGKRLSEREKASLYYHLFGGVDDWHLLYKIADNLPMNKKESVHLDTYVSKWKNSDKVKDFIFQIKRQLYEHQQAEKQQLKEEIKNELQNQGGESDHTKTKGRKETNILVDYSDPKNRLALYNEIIANSESDPKTQLDTAKLFEQIQKDDREALKAQKQTRVYLPLRCESCPLYNQQTTK